jgi:hypothetical protein
MTVVNEAQIGMPIYIDTNGGNSTVTVSTTRAHSGSKSLQLTTDTGRVELDLIPGALVSDELFYDFWVYVPSSITVNQGNGEFFLLFQLEGAIEPGYDPIFSMMLADNGHTTVRLGGRDNNNDPINIGDNCIADSGLSFPRDEWVHVEWYTKIAVNGLFKAWMNGASLWDVSGIDNTGLNQVWKYFMPAVYGCNGTIWVDDQALYDYNAHTDTPAGGQQLFTLLNAMGY